VRQHKASGRSAIISVGVGVVIFCPHLWPLAMRLLGR
jgi:hypothetical protein